MTLTPTNVTVHVAPHPFALERVTHQLPAGASIAVMLQELQPDAVLRQCAHVLLDGCVIAPKHWPRVLPKPGTTLTVRMVPQGGGSGGKNPLRTVLSIAVLAASPVVAGSLASALGASGSILGISTARLITGGVNLLGRLALNAIAPPPRPRYAMGSKDAPVYSISNAQNKLQPFARVPKVLGRHRFVPPLGAMPYTETVGSDQYLRMLFVWGYGPLEISDLKIGETPLAEFEGVEIETRQGYGDDAPLTLYSNAVLQNDLQVVLRAAAGHVLRTSEADAEELSIDVTFPRGLFRFGGGNNKLPSTVNIEVQYAPAGSDDWSTSATEMRSVAAQNIEMPAPPVATTMNGMVIQAQRIDSIVLDAAAATLRVISGDVWRADLAVTPAPAVPVTPAGCAVLAHVLRRSGQDTVLSEHITDMRATTRPGIVFSAVGDFLVGAHVSANMVQVAAGALTYTALQVTAKQTTTLRRAVSFKVPKGQYDVRVRRLTVDAIDENIFDECMWTALRTVRSTQPVRMQGLAMTALRIKATDQLNGVIERFNGVVHSLLPDWTGAEWVVQPTSNPAALYRHVLQGVGNDRPLPDSRIDLTRLQEWHDRCRLSGRAYDAVIDYDTSVREVLQDVAALGRASPAIIDGRWSVVEDMPQDVPVQHFTPRNTVHFEAQKTFDEQPQALRVRFINRDKGWAADERLVFADGFNESTASRYETLELAGVTSADQAWKHGRYHLATAQLRPELYQFTTDIEHLVCTRGDMIRLTHDVPMFGLASARISALGFNGSGDIDSIVLDNDITQEAGKSYCLRCRSIDGSSIVLTLVTEAGQGRTVTLATPLLAGDSLQVGDLAMFGESGQESVALVVKSIVPQGDLSARLSCVDAAPEIHLADSGLIPAFKSNISLSDAERTPPSPAVIEVQSGEESLIRHADGSLTTRIVVTLLPPSYSRPLTTQVLIRGEGEQLFVPADILGSDNATQISIVGVEEGQRYDIQLRYIADNNSRSLPRLIAGYQVTGTAAVPSNVAEMTISVVGDMAHLRWTPVDDIDLSHYCVRHSAQTSGAEWSNAIDIAPYVPLDASTWALPALAGSYLIKAVDVGGRVSAEAAKAQSPVGALQGYNAVLAIDEGEDGFTGEKTNLARISGAIRLDGLDQFDEIGDLDALLSLDTGYSGLRSEGSYLFANIYDLGEVYTSRVTATIAVQGLDMSTSVDQWVDVDVSESWDLSVDPAAWSARLQISTTGDDPAIEDAWSPWADFTVGDYAARAVRFRLLLQGSGGTITPVVDMLRINIDMPDRYESATGIIQPDSGAVVDFNYAFRAVPALQITPHDMNSGDYYRLTDIDEAGFALRFFDAGGSGVSRRFDYVAKGYGRVNA